MKIQQLNATDAEKVFGAYTNREGSTLAADAAVQLDLTAATLDGNGIVQPNSAELNAVVGVNDASLADDVTGLVQMYGYRGTSKVLLTDTTQAAGAALVAVAGQDYLASGTQLHPWFVLLQSHTTGTGTVSKKILIRAL